jgi:aminoglycoside 2'-N-acetyltransferase I
VFSPAVHRQDVDVIEVQTAHTAELDDTVLGAAHHVVRDAFGSHFTEHDWEHSLGGVHALLWDGPELVGHGAVVQRRMLHGQRALRTGYVEGVAVRADRRRRGCGGLLMEALERVVRGGYELGALAATDEGAALYVQRGWRLWTGPTSVLSPRGVERTPEEDGGVYVLPVTASVDLTGEITCDWREGDVW